MQRAYYHWSRVSGLTFRPQSSGNADMKILFARGNHNDGNSFDGKGGVLAHVHIYIKTSYFRKKSVTLILII